MSQNYIKLSICRIYFTSAFKIETQSFRSSYLELAIQSVQDITKNIVLMKIIISGTIELK